MSSPERPLTLPHATALVIGSMIGTGVFTTSGLVLAELRAPLAVLGVWALAGVLAMAGAVVYAELGAMMPRAGGEYVYLSRGFHPAVGWASGWVSLLVGFAAPVAATGLAFGRYVHVLAPAVPVKVAALALIVAVTLLHARDVRGGGAVQAALTGLVLALIAAFIGGGLLSGAAEAGRLRAEPLPPQAGHAGGLAVALVYVAYSYFGWNAVAYVAGELRDPDRTVPRAVIGGAGLVTAIYLVLNTVFLTSAPAAALAGQVEVADVAARALFGGTGATLLSSLVALALAGTASALVMTGPRVVRAMAEDGLFHRGLAATNARGAPTAAVLLQSALSIAAVLTAAFEPLLVYAGFTLTLSSAATVTAAFVLRRREPAARRPYRALAWPWSGIAYLGLAAFMLVFAVRERPLESAAGVATLAVGAAAFFIVRPGR